MPGDFPVAGWGAGCFDADLCAVRRIASGYKAEPTAAILEKMVLRSTPESGPRAGYDGGKRKKESKRHLLVLHVTPASRDDRAEVGRLAVVIQDATGESVELVYVDRDYTAEKPAGTAWVHVEVVERSFARATRCRRPVKDYGRYASTFACFMLRHAATCVQGT
nr:hypothetical protein [Komagataeibacter kakiaceti]